jgi:hypothetical protein
MPDTFYETEFLENGDEPALPQSTTKLRWALLEKYKDDKYLFHLKRVVNRKKVLVHVFGSGDAGSSIRDAVTGERYTQHKVGSNSEHLYFKVGIHTGELGKCAPNLFFESPEQYERHFGVRLEDGMKETWYLKRAKISALLLCKDQKNLTCFKK